MLQNKARRTPGRPRKFDETEALDKATLVFWDLGYDAADTETLTKSMGISKPSLYNAFGSKEDLFVAALTRYRELRSEESLQALLSGETPQDGLRNFFETFAQNVAGEAGPKGCLMLTIAMPLRTRLDSVDAVFSAHGQTQFRQITRFFEDHRQAGRLPEAFNIQAAIAMMSDLNAATATQARAGAGFQALRAKIERNVALVLYEGERAAQCPPLPSSS